MRTDLFTDQIATVIKNAYIVVGLFGLAAYFSMVFVPQFGAHAGNPTFMGFAYVISAVVGMSIVIPLLVFAATHSIAEVTKTQAKKIIALLILAALVGPVPLSLADKATAARSASTNPINGH